MKIIKDISYSNINHQRQVLDLYLPDCDEFDVFIYFHGGGLETGDKTWATKMGEFLAEHGVAMVAANYRMYPSAVFPEFIRDAAAAVAWTYKNISQYGKCDKFYVGGSSAGAYISMMLCFDKKYFAPYKIDPAQITGYIHDAGQPTTHFNVLRERGVDSRRVIVDEAAPLHYIGVEKAYAPMLFLVADNDMENRLEQTMLVASTLKHFGYDEAKYEIRVLKGTHCCYEEKGLEQIVFEYICRNKK